MTPAKFQKEILSYYKEHKRLMPWRDISNPYKIFISEMMLQQTQVERVKIKYTEFIKKFPNIKSVADASTNDILKLWQGLGYNRRAIFIKRSCEEIVENHKGIFPKDLVTLQTLPGIGPSSAGAIYAFAYNKPVDFIETNIRVVLLYFFFKNKEKVTDKILLEKLKKVTPADIDPRDWYYALYDYGAYLKKILGKEKTDLHKQSKHYSLQSKFEGSFRQKRAKVLRMILNDEEIVGMEDVMDSLRKDGLI
ncbi:A/G-specific adenine glycosylase [Arenimonas sp.]|nr:A/G-specific adenine glycosylase [Candidatus Parcubacteria bacterium]